MHVSRTYWGGATHSKLVVFHRFRRTTHRHVSLSLSPQARVYGQTTKERLTVCLFYLVSLMSLEDLGLLRRAMTSQ